MRVKGHICTQQLTEKSSYHGTTKVLKSVVNYTLDLQMLQYTKIKTMYCILTVLFFLQVYYSKKLGKHRAVDGLCLGVPKGEVSCALLHSRRIFNCF